MHTPTETEVVVRPNDLDRLGHVNHAVAVEYFEVGRWAWVTERVAAPDAAVLPVVVRLEVDYRRELGPGRVRVCTALVSPIERDGVTYQAVFEQTIHPDDGAPAVLARVQVGFLDARTRALTTAQAFLGWEDP